MRTEVLFLISWVEGELRGLRLGKSESGHPLCFGENVNASKNDFPVIQLEPSY